MAHYDCLVVGAGPAGATTAFLLACAGARVALIDRATFPRDKTCAGGVTLRGARELGFTLAPVVEREVYDIELRLGARRVVHRSPAPLVLMTRRRRLDTYLVERAVAAGAELHDGRRVREVALTSTGARVRAGRDVLHGDALVGADGANGACAQALGLAHQPLPTVALEADVDIARVSPELSSRMLFEVGTLPCGYGWAFPKDDVVNVGVWGWPRAGPRLRAHLSRLCATLGIDPAQLRDHRGHRIPLRGMRAAVARGRALLVGDAAGLADPFSGDGISQAIRSAGMAAPVLLEVLAGRRSDLDPYRRGLEAMLARERPATWLAKLALERWPERAFSLAARPTAGRAIARRVRGERPVGLCGPPALWARAERAARRRLGDAAGGDRACASDHLGPADPPADRTPPG